MLQSITIPVEAAFEEQMPQGGSLLGSTADWVRKNILPLNQGMLVVRRHRTHAAGDAFIVRGWGEGGAG
jgi:hypothetical protein